MPRIQALARASAIIDEIAAGGEEGVGLSDISRATELNKTTAFNLIASLVALGFLEQDVHSRRYRLEIGPAGGDFRNGPPGESCDRHRLAGRAEALTAHPLRSPARGASVGKWSRTTACGRASSSRRVRWPILGQNVT